MARVDAIICPPGFVEGQSPYWEMAQYAAAFAPILKVSTLHKKTLKDGREFFPKSIDDTFYFPQGHPLEGRDRYIWRERKEGDGVLYGTLVDEAKAEPPDEGHPDQGERPSIA